MMTMMKFWLLSTEVFVTIILWPISNGKMVAKVQVWDAK